MNAGTLDSNRLLLVEGKDDEEFFSHLRTYLALDSNAIAIRPYDGKNNLRKRLESVSLASNFINVRALGIVRDADENPDGAFESVRDALGMLVETPPSEPLEFQESTFKDIHRHLAGKPIWTGIAILPGNSKPGELEDLLLDAIEDTETMACVDEYIHCLSARGISLQKLAKTRLQAFLASRERAETGLWKALARDHIRVDSYSFAMVRGFLSGLHECGR